MLLFFHPDARINVGNVRFPQTTDVSKHHIPSGSVFFKLYVTDLGAVATTTTKKRS